MLLEVGVIGGFLLGGVAGYSFGLTRRPRVVRPATVWGEALDRAPAPAPVPVGPDGEVVADPWWTVWRDVDGKQWEWPYPKDKGGKASQLFCHIRDHGEPGRMELRQKVGGEWTVRDAYEASGG